MNAGPSFLAELKRRNVLRAAVLYIGAVWAFGQGLSQFSPALGLPDRTTRWFLIAATVGFPFWLAFAWIFEITPQGLKRENGVPADASIMRSTGRKLDFAIIAVLSVAVILLLGNQFLWHRGVAQTTLAATSTQAKTGILANSVAVLPFVNEGGAPGEQFFSDGLSEDLINALSQFEDLKVISRNSAFQFRNSNKSSQDIGKQLGVTHLVEGSAQRTGEEVRVTVTLVDAGDGHVVWSQRYDKPSKDLFALQDACTQAVADALKVELPKGGEVLQTDRPPSNDLDAYLAY